MHWPRPQLLGGRNPPDPDVVSGFNRTKGTIVAERIVWATGPVRGRGLLGRDRLDTGDGIYLVPCKWIHMFGMRFPIDVAFLAADGRVLAVHPGLRPGRLSRPVWRAAGVLELASGALQESRTAVGDIIELVPMAPRDS